LLELSLIVVIALLSLPATPVETAEQKGPKPQMTTMAAPAQTPALAPAAAPVPVPTGPAAIPVADVATRAAEVANLLQGITQKLAPTNVPLTSKQGRI